jgi:hypothetical protein
LATGATHAGHTIGAHDRTETTSTCVAAISTIGTSATIAAVPSSKSAIRAGNACDPIHPSTAITTVAAETLCAWD